ncbi:MAG: hypothetical protein U1E50_07025 [Caulobacteraceae bacterium]
MKDQIDLKGASGALYRFQRLREGHPLSPMGGNWVYVRDEMEGQFKVLCCGEGENLMAGARLRWDEAVSMQGASELYTRLNISQVVRRDENADLIAGYRPPMNPPQEASSAA